MSYRDEDQALLERIRAEKSEADLLLSEAEEEISAALAVLANLARLGGTADRSLEHKRAELEAIDRDATMPERDRLDALEKWNREVKSTLAENNVQQTADALNRTLLAQIRTLNASPAARSNALKQALVAIELLRDRSSSFVQDEQWQLLFERVRAAEEKARLQAESLAYLEKAELSKSRWREAWPFGFSVLGISFAIAALLMVAKLGTMLVDLTTATRQWAQEGYPADALWGLGSGVVVVAIFYGLGVLAVRSQKK